MRKQVSSGSSVEIIYRTQDPVYLRFFNHPSLQVHLRRKGTGRYSIDNAHSLDGISTEIQVFFSGRRCFKNVYEAGDVALRSILFGLSEDAAGALLGDAATGIFDHAPNQTFHSRVPIKPDLVTLIDELFETDEEPLSDMGREARRLEMLPLSPSKVVTSRKDALSSYRTCPSDVARLRVTAPPIELHLDGDLPQDRLAAIAGMNVTQLKALFCELHCVSVGCATRIVPFGSGRPKMNRMCLSLDRPCLIKPWERSQTSHGQGRHHRPADDRKT